MEVEVLRPRWWRSWGVWAPVAVAGLSISRLLMGSTIPVVDGLLLVMAVVVLAMSLFGGIEVGPNGVKGRRFTSKRKAARWDEIEGFLVDYKAPLSARLKDGSSLRLLDYAGDNARMIELLKDARSRFSDEPGPGERGADKPAADDEGSEASAPSEPAVNEPASDGPASDGPASDER